MCIFEGYDLTEFFVWATNQFFDGERFKIN